MGGGGGHEPFFRRHQIFLRILLVYAKTIAVKHSGKVAPAVGQVMNNEVDSKRKQPGVFCSETTWAGVTQQSTYDPGATGKKMGDWNELKDAGKDSSTC